MAALDIIIVNWNAGDQLARCLRSICAAGREGLTLNRVVVVDNASTDGSLHGLDELPLPLTIIKNERNLGFAAACNQGAVGGKADYLLFLNPDTELFDHSLSAPVAFMELPANRSIGICGIRLIDEKGEMTTSAAHFPTLRVFIGKVVGLSTIFPRLFPGHLMVADELLSDRAVDQVIGAFFLVRKNLFEENGGFDERFFVYFEEVDFSLRLRQQGYLSYFIHGVTAYHKGGGCSEQVKAERLYYSLRSRLQYAAKHYSVAEYVVLFVLTLAIEQCVRVVAATVRGSVTQVKETLLAYVKLINWGIRSGFHR